MAANFLDENSIESIYDEMQAVYLNDNRPWIIGYSGGKDSTVCTELTFRMLMRLPKEKRTKPVYIVSSDTLIENPVILNYLNYNIKKINESAKKLDLPVEGIVVKPDSTNTYWTNIIGKGYPTPKSIQYRWCTERLKIRPSNDFIKKQLEKEDVVVILGVRKDESIARKARIEKREIDGYLLTPHGTLKSKNKLAYVYTPIVDFTTADVWDVLVNSNENTVPTPDDIFDHPATCWGTDTMELFNLYLKGSGDSGECPFIADESTAKSSCGNSRFGCWICTVVKEDKSLNGFIESGHDELKPLLAFRQWILSIRDIPENRKKHKRNGSVVKRDGRIMMGPFTFEARQMILRKLLETQLEIQKFYPELNLITLDELKAINDIWDDEEDLTSTTLLKIYKDVIGKDLPWAEYKKPMFDKSTLDIVKQKCSEYNVDTDLFSKLLIDSNKYKHFSNNTKLKNSINKTLNQQWLHQDIVEKIEDEGNKELNYED
nr:DNA phosphorothioation system sulfurtransferase DndC [uncultured Terrisporobacter sp.]